jgi:hypothetical protein
MAGYERKLRVSEFTVDHVQVSPAHGTGTDADQKLAGASFRNRKVGQPQGLAGCFEKHGTHEWTL